MTSADHSFICASCGKSHEGLPTDFGYTLPDVVWAIPADQREELATFTKDLCEFGDRRFIRCLLPVPFIARPGSYCFGVWTEVERASFDRYYELYNEDATSEPAFSGLLANEVHGYERVLGLPVLVQLQDSTSRPHVRFPLGAGHAFALDQECGINEDRYHQILIATGAIEP